MNVKKKIKTIDEQFQRIAKNHKQSKKKNKKNIPSVYRAYIFQFQSCTMLHDACDRRKSAHFSWRSLTQEKKSYNLNECIIENQIHLIAT